MSGPDPDPKEETPSPSPTPGGDPAEPAAPKGAAALKLKLAALFAKAKGFVPDIPKPQIDSASIKTGFNAFMKDVVTLPMLLWTGDALTRLAVIGFVLSVTLLVLTMPQMLQVVLRSAPVKIPGFTAEPAKQVVVAAPKPAPLKTLGPVAYIGELQGQFEGGGTFAVEVFLELTSEEDASQIRIQEEKTRAALLAAFSKLTREDWISEEGRKEALAALQAAAAEATTIRPQRVLVTKEALTAGEPAPAPAVPEPTTSESHH